MPQMGEMILTTDTPNSMPTYVFLSVSHETQSFICCIFNLFEQTHKLAHIKAFYIQPTLKPIGFEHLRFETRGRPRWRL